MASIEDMLDDMGDMGEIELDLDEDALLADDDDKAMSNSRIESKLEDDDFIEIGVEDDIDDLKVDSGEKKVMAYDENDSEDENKERSRFKAERNISSVPRPNNAIPETLDAVPVKTNFTTPNPRGKRNFRGGPVRGGRQRPANGQNFQPIHPPQRPPPPPHQQYSGNIHVNPHFRSNLNLPGSGSWNGWAPEQRAMAPHHFQDPNYNHWNDNNRVDYYQQPYPEQNYYNGGDQYYNNYPQQWDQYYPPHDFPRYPPMEQPFRNVPPNNFAPGPNFHGPPMHPSRFPPPPPPKMAKFRGGRGTAPPIKSMNKPPNQGYQQKSTVKQQRNDALRKVQISNLHEVKMVDPVKTTKPEPEEEDEYTKEYRLKIEEQKKLREAVLRQKEEKRKAAQQKSHIEAGVPDSIEEKTDGVQTEEYRIVRVRGANGKTVLKKLTLEQISKLKKVDPPPQPESVKNDLVSQTVAIDNLSASTTNKQIEEMAKMVGPYEKISLDPISKKAVIKFKSEESATAFMKRNQRKMVDLSMITVRLIPNE